MVREAEKGVGDEPRPEISSCEELLDGISGQKEFVCHNHQDVSVVRTTLHLGGLILAINSLLDLLQEALLVPDEMLALPLERPLKSLLVDEFRHLDPAPLAVDHGLAVGWVLTFRPGA